MAPRRLGVLALVALSLVAAFPAPAAAGARDPTGVGSFLVDAAGHAEGANVALVVTEASGRITGFAANGAPVVDELVVDGFRPTSKLAGVGSAALRLTGDVADLEMHDAPHAAVVVAAHRATSAHATLADGLAATGDGGRVDVTGADGAVGSFLLLGPGGLAAHDRRLDAYLEAGARLVWRASSGDAEFESLTYDAILDGPAVEVATALHGSRTATSVVRYADAVSADVSPVPAGAKVEVDGAATLLLDLAYATLPAASSDEVAVFVDGVPGSAVLRTVADRTRAIVALPDEGPHRVVVAAVAGGGAEHQALAEGRARQAASIQGGFTLHGDRAVGRHVAFGVDAADAAIEDLVLVTRGVTLLDAVDATGDGHARLTADGATARLDSASTSFVVADDVHASLALDAPGGAQVLVDLADGVRVDDDGAYAVVLEGPAGVRATLFVAMSDGTRAEKSGFAEVAPGLIVARLERGARLLLRVDDATDAATAEALGSGAVALQVDVGWMDGAVGARSFAYADAASVEVVAAEPGRVEIHVDGGVFLLDGRGGALAAREPGDVRVTVDGAAAVRAEDVADVLASAFPAYAVRTTDEGDPRLVVNAGGDASVVVESALAKAAQDSARADGFGHFRVFGDGTAVGSFVSLRADRTAGVVSDYTLLATGQRVFLSVAAGASPFLAGGAGGSARLVLDSAETSFEAADVTSGYLRIVAERATKVAFRLDPGVTAQPTDANVLALRTVHGVLGSMVVANAEGRGARGSSFAVDGDRVVATLQKGAQVVFRTHVGIEQELDDAQRAEVDRAIARGDVAGHVLVQTERALAADAPVTSAVATSNYDDVQILTAATRHEVEVTISSTTSSGRTLIVSLDPETVPGMGEGLAEILLDGEALAHASSYADVLDPSDDHGRGEYFVLAGEAGTQVLVSIPHFSTRSVTLRERSAFAGPPVFMYATIALSVLLAVETVFIARRRGDKK